MLHPRKVLKKTAAGILMLFLLFFNLGCWDRQEIDKLSLAMVAGIDYCPEKNQIVYTSLIARPGQLGGGTEGGVGQLFMGPVWVAQSTGKTIFEASRNIAVKDPRRLFESHMQAMVVGEELARRGIGELVDFIVREREHRLIHPLLVTKCTAGEVIRAEPQLENILSQEIKGLLENQQNLSAAPTMDLKDFLNALNRPGADAYAPVIEVREKNPAPDEEFIGSSERNKKFISVQGTAVFSEDKLAGYLNVPETKGLLWVRGEVNRANLIPRQSNGGQVTVYITRSISKLEPEFTENCLKMSIQVETEGDIAAANIKQDITDPKVIEELEKTLANQIKQEILMAVTKSKEFKSDFFAFGASFRRKDQKKWKEIEENWRELLPEVEIEVRVSAEIRRTGLISPPIIQE
ncbi:Ger(x)C family spore germination protein [Candidatus Contubernalis alkaliaceticus]|uniref:Ger(x)C family spore germination protein n=1 Tax=Candidatus Contubernalis alkaliaceticus TaxID=338645 RepID=UPI001F4BCFDD|nr:Ger(x)C family spore germination protein [Candidatus Contubernalis alkalaceticus]UNC93317.1 Ger(x)C family spore germination protein [Candidatus Contubernalis alkalaceticus]